jgi:hypothetical protein
METKTLQRRSHSSEPIPRLGDAARAAAKDRATSSAPVGSNVESPATARYEITRVAAGPPAPMSAVPGVVYCFRLGDNV